MKAGDGLCVKSSKEDIEAFLEDVYEALDGKLYSSVDRKKNTDCLAMLGWKWADAFDELYNLTYHDYFRGPEIDRVCPTDDDFWEFKKTIEGRHIYIKLKIRYLQDRSLLLFSFHIDGM